MWTSNSHAHVQSLGLFKPNSCHLPCFPPSLWGPHLGLCIQMEPLCPWSPPLPMCFSQTIPSPLFHLASPSSLLLGHIRDTAPQVLHFLPLTSLFCPVTLIYWPNGTSTQSQVWGWFKEHTSCRTKNCLQWCDVPWEWVLSLCSLFPRY